MGLYGFRAAFSSRGGIMDWKEIDKVFAINPADTDN